MIGMPASAEGFDISELEVDGEMWALVDRARDGEGPWAFVFRRKRDMRIFTMSYSRMWGVVARMTLGEDVVVPEGL